jgi:hypothetical protein
MSYFTVATCQNDWEFQRRVTACYQEQGGDPTAVPGDLFWTVAAADDVEAAYASALAAENPHPGSDESVITDAMILGVVQANPTVP